MPVYVAIFLLKGLHSLKTYDTLSCVIASFNPNLTFSDPAAPFPSAVVFASEHPIEKVLDRLKEHLYPADDLVLFEATRGSSSIHANEVRKIFEQLIARL